MEQTSKGPAIKNSWNSPISFSFASKSGIPEKLTPNDLGDSISSWKNRFFTLLFWGQWKVSTPDPLESRSKRKGKPFITRKFATRKRSAKEKLKLWVGWTFGASGPLWLFNPRRGRSRSGVIFARRGNFQKHRPIERGENDSWKTQIFTKPVLGGIEQMNGRPVSNRFERSFIKMFIWLTFEERVSCWFENPTHRQKYLWLETF